MKVFVSVLEFKTNKSNNINVTNAASPKDCDIFNPGSLNQKLGLEQGLTVLLYESFYVC